STYSAALVGAVVKVRHRGPACNPKLHAVCDVPAGRPKWMCPAPRGTGHPLLPPRGPPAPDKRDSPSRLAFRPPAERAFESPLQLLRPASTYSAALDGAVVKLRHQAAHCNPKVHALCGVGETTFPSARVAAHARVH